MENRYIGYIKSFGRNFTGILAIIAITVTILYARGCFSSLQPKTGASVALTGKNIKATIQPVEATRTTRGDVSLPKVTGEIILESDFKKGDKIPVELDLSAVQSKSRGGKHKLSVTYLDQFVVGYNYELLNLWDLTCDIGINTRGAQIGAGWSWTEHSQLYIGYSVGMPIVGVNFRF